MEVFRLQNRKYPIELSGKGAAMIGARWNSKGTEVIYTAQNRALAMAEVAVHLTMAMLPSKFCMISVNIPDSIAIKTVKTSELPKGWNSFPEMSGTQKLGDKWLFDGEFCVIKVPSAVVKGEFNFLINPRHKDFRRIKITHEEDFPFDKRIFS
ncbi:MAG: RES domain-containing protein [Flavobacterium sp.]|uniref:RES family NAD+ phosphorylase n=1 Tax=Flavobacterium sp. TaxID=239 RepID=UPI00121F27C2|nr:RES family NAD+ phosphorylase [Flavobacterium sp.]RZJ65659.1 MAG: RES domain-containing protein [Flavobacterium sp.]